LLQLLQCCPKVLGLLDQRLPRVCAVCGCNRGGRCRFKHALEVVQETRQDTRVFRHRCLLCCCPGKHAFHGDAHLLLHCPALCESLLQAWLPCQTSAAPSASVR